MSSPRVLFLVTEDKYFLSHRLALALELQRRGATIAVATVGDQSESIRKLGFEHFRIPFDRKRINPLAEVLTLLAIIRLYARLKPDVVHHISIKPIVYGSLAARLTGLRYLNTVTGLGYAFTSPTPRARAIRKVIEILFGFCFASRRCFTIFQNPDDYAFFRQKHFVDTARSFVILGSGVDTEKFYPAEEPQGLPTILVTSRMLWDKGIADIVEAAAILKAKGVQARVLLAGASDPHNPSAVPESQLKAWADEGLVECLGFQTDIPRLLAAAHIVCLPSHREGLPMSLLEAAAAGRPIVTTDAPGCREVVRDGYNGLLVPVSAPKQLASALETLIADPTLRRRMGAASRAMAVEMFSTKEINSRTLEAYKLALASEFDDVAAGPTSPTEPSS